MAYEIELKAWVDDVAAVELRMNEAAEFLFSYTKEDVYWYSCGTAAFPSGVRLRKESRTFKTGAAETCLFVTYKIKETRNGIEVNDEKEFRITSAPDAAAATAASTPDGRPAPDAAAPFETFLALAGFTAGFAKKKAGKCWLYTRAGVCGEGRARFPSITAELSLVDGLGHFLELETIAPDDKPATVNAARDALLDLLKIAGIPPARIESRYYSEMLQQQTQ
ncbi:MAG: CYTH domain-containing protein [Spirochaetaceae bacterium]|jgi:adenylate cyclase class 2|nr:CYTH domain-containing protein [Spirochaetaceae bacterium]